MQHLKALRTISLILSLAPVTLGLLAGSCATGKNQQTNVSKLKAEAVSQGIRLTFDNIPSKTNRLFINVQSWDDAEKLTGTHNLVSSYADVRDASLEQVKQTGKIILPIVQTGRKYSISAVFQNGDLEDISDWIYADCVADNGIYFDNDIKLILVDNNTGVKLSSEPLFSSEVTFDSQKYSYAVTISHYKNETESGSIGVGSHHIPAVNGLTWTFDPEMTDSLREGNYLESGSYPAYVTARCNIIYDNIVWSIEIAKTQEYTFSL